ncbi:MAG: hypothetical protein WCO24_05410, partial [Actinomycetes bacterium]
AVSCPQQTEIFFSAPFGVLHAAGNFSHTQKPLGSNSQGSQLANQNLCDSRTIGGSHNLAAFRSYAQATANFAKSLAKSSVVRSAPLHYRT